MAVVLEVGPVAVRRLGDPRSDECAEAFLDGIDDAVVLVGERPVNVDDVWRDMVRGSDDLLVVHPSWWPRYRVERLSSAAGVRCMRRCDFIAERIARPFIAERIAAPLTIVEVDRELVTVADGTATPAVHDRHDVEAIAAAVRADGDVMFDAPPGVHGDELRTALIDRGIPLCDVDLDELERTGSAPTRVAPTRSPRRRPALALTFAVAVVLVAVAVVRGLWHRPGSSPAPEPDTVALVEGRVAVAVPARWTVQRITGGPGSHRLQVNEPGAAGAAGAAVHITQAYVPDSDLGAAAEILGRAAAAQPAGVFTDLHIAVVAGRDAVVYREARPGRVIRWSVLLDGATRIAIGCQSPPGAEESVRLACEDAVRSAREVPSLADPADRAGTEPGPPAS